MKNFFKFERVNEFFWEKTTICFSEQLSFHRKLSSERARARARPNHAKDDAQKGSAM